jgi:hypothetical protein
MTFIKTAAQGEITIRKIAKLPKAVAKLAKENGKVIVGHSETGHHHVLERDAQVFVATSAPDGMRVLYALIEQPNALVHERSFDTHAPIALEPGIYEMRIGREYDPYAEVARRQAD